ncbi:hypothetical protein CDL12_01399 [Handroanthus impetiginosus]|uniref:Uncharacterized protein n=1 Tax=Handroanthus impetiginosus TaxID=429701 RepID=A0A2G9I7W1_9LAMI|nr:hypothetical protein CDL12_01399 [Handroanthus impetiginosus]
MAQNRYGGLEHGVMQRPPLRHAWNTISHDDDHDQTAQEQFGFEVQQEHRHGMNSPSSAGKKSPLMFQGQWRCGKKGQRTRGCGGPGMQAVFLGSHTRSCGTGVFLPRTGGADPRFTNKPGVAPVLLPSRVVHALNLNVHELGQQIKAQPDQCKNMMKKMDEKMENKNKADDAYLSPEIFLPEEWIY